VGDTLDIHQLLGFVLLLTLTGGCASKGSDPHSPAVSTAPGSALSTDAGCAAVPASGEAPLIDDFGDGDTRLVAADGRAGAWFFYNDATSGQQAHALEDDAGNPALHVTSSEWTTWGSGVGVPLAASSTAQRTCPYDAQVYSGVQFRAKGVGRVRVRLASPESTPVAEGGACTLPGNDCFDWPGVSLDLEPAWRVYTLPFCQFRPEGWSSAGFELDPSRLSAVHFMLQSGSDVDFWVDDLTFTTATAELVAEAGAAGCAALCPLAAAPAAARFEPESSYLPLTGGLELHTFEQESTRCGPLTRRYLSFVPATLEKESTAPIVIALHGSGANAESMQDLQTRGRLDELAERDGVIVIYGNAAPGASSSADTRVTNTGSWRQEMYDDEEVDDVEYLNLVLSDLKRRGVIRGDNHLYLTGLSNGGGMVLAAARKLPERVSGIAAFMPFDGNKPLPIPDLQTALLSRVLFAYSVTDPGLPAGYVEVLSQLPAHWAAALGIPATTLTQASSEPLPDRVTEGDGYTGTNAIALGTRDSGASQLEYVHSARDARVRTLVFDHAGHFWPTPVGDTEDWILDRWGFRNQDLDGADALWEFFELGDAGP
jgi:poly(3-hydroxybutyrate) depolymerase